MSLASAQASGANLDVLMAWFREGTDGDKKASLAFPASLTKEQRAQVHVVVKSVGLGSLESVSQGVGLERFISVVCSGEGPSAEVSKAFEGSVEGFCLVAMHTPQCFDVMCRYSSSLCCFNAL